MTETSSSRRARVLGRVPGDPDRWRRAWRIARWPLAAALVVFIGGLAAFAYLYAALELPDREPAPSSSVVLDANGLELATISGEQFRRKVSLDEVAPVVVDALIAIEDRRFYEHQGVDGVGVLRAAVNNLRGEDLEGGSTLTQQLVKNAYLTSDRTLSRKAKEAVLAVKLEREMDKDEIVETYLNTVYFGRGAYGIEAAAEVYFDTTADELDLAQAAYLVGVLQRPETLDAADDPSGAEARRAEVLAAMVETGVIDDAEAERASRDPIAVVDVGDTVTLGEGAGAHFVDWVHQQVDAELGPGAATSEGLVIHTTLDLEDQVVAEAAVADVLDQPDDPEAALVAVDGTGAIRAMVGSRDHERLQVNLALGEAGGGTGRQPGSTFKPVALMGALEGGTTLATDYRAPGEITVETDAGPYTVSNYDGADKGVIDLEAATVGSVNTVYAQLAAEVGGDDLADVARRGGVDAALEALPSLALGSGEVAPLDLADLYSTFARRGEHVEPFAIVRIEDADGDVLFEHEGSAERAFEQAHADAVNHVLQRAVAEGTGQAARLPDRSVAGKTGTTQDFGDAWFAGYVPDYTAVVWMGYPEGQARGMTSVHGRSVSGGSFPAEIWRRFAEGALADVEPSAFADPPADLFDDPDRRTLEVAGGPFEPGDEVVVRGSGYELCTAGWSVAVRGADVSSSPERGDASDRRARLALPDDIEPGSYTAEARCDVGAGPDTAAQASFEVVDPSDTSSSSSSSTSTTERERPDSSTTTAPPPPPSSTTSTTAANETTTTTESSGD